MDVCIDISAMMFIESFLFIEESFLFIEVFCIDFFMLIETLESTQTGTERALSRPPQTLEALSRPPKFTKLNELNELKERSRGHPKP